MKKEIQSKKRREFLGSLVAGAATLGISAMSSSARAETHLSANEDTTSIEGAEAWFEKVKGNHRVVFDVPIPNHNYPFGWPRNFLLSNSKTGTPESDCGVVVVLRHRAIPYALESSLWEKYKFGTVYKIDDDLTKAPAVRNPFWKPKPGDYKVPGIGNFAIGIDELQASGVMFCVCATAIMVNSNVLANGADPKEVEKELINGILPGIQLVPSGVWALGRAQEKKCGYIFCG